MALRWALAESEEGGTLFPDERVAERHVGKGAYAGMEFLHVNARTIINTVPPESRMPFRHTINPYRGCSHACVYCFARPTHDYLGLGIGEDFERKIVVKVNAVERLRAELRSPKWGGDHIAMGTNTDPYQHAEGKYHLTRGIVETLSRGAQPVQHPDQVDARSCATARCWPRRRERTDVAVQLLHRDARPLRLAADRAGHAPAGPAGGGAAAPDRPGHPVRGAGGARAARALGLRGPAARGGRGLRGGRRGVHQRGGAAPARARCARTTSTGSRAPGRTWSACTGGASGAAPTRRTRSASGWRASCGRRRSRCGVTGRDRYRGRRARATAPATEHRHGAGGPASSCACSERRDAGAPSRQLRRSL